MDRIILAEYKKVQKYSWGVSYDARTVNAIKASYMWHEHLKKCKKSGEKMLNFQEFCHQYELIGASLPDKEEFVEFSPYNKKKLTFFKTIKYAKIDERILEYLMTSLYVTCIFTDNRKRRLFINLESYRSLRYILSELYDMKIYASSSEVKRNIKKYIDIFDTLSPKDFSEKAYCIIIEREVSY